jgi:hypothetical protein
VFAFAWRHRRILLTHDEDFWDDRRFPEHRNPGLAILPGATGNDMISGLWWMMVLMERDLWQKQKLRITQDGEVYIRRRDRKNGKNRHRSLPLQQRRDPAPMTGSPGPPQPGDQLGDVGSRVGN